jgi:hypothetical protein
MPFADDATALCLICRDPADDLVELTPKVGDGESKAKLMCESCIQEINADNSRDLEPGTDHLDGGEP